MKKLTLLLLLLATACGASADKSLELFPYGAVKPAGWILDQMKNDLSEGITGNFDKINNTVNLDLYVKKERNSGRRYEKVGEPGSLLCWWSGEHEAYWKESMFRLAYLTGDRAAMDRVDKWVDEILASTDESGYIGIYADDKPGVSRYDHDGENGELWTQGLMNSALLSYYEFTGRKDVLDAVEKSAHLTMKAYSEKPAFEESKGGGVSHAVGYFELLEWLYRLTGKEEYRAFTLKMREDMENSILRDDDLKKGLLLDADRKFKMHGAHIGEGFVIPQFVAMLSADTSDIRAADMALEKLRFHLAPTGAMVCDEHINDMAGNADNRYEYCSTVELINSLDKVMAMRDELEIGDIIEKATFNSLQGARLPDGKGLSYLTHDNRIEMKIDGHGGRDTYDACHHAAACCPLTLGRLMPVYVHGMWMHDKGNSQIVAALYGPSVLDTEIGGTALKIEEKTTYPFGDNVVFDISLTKRKRFALVLRKPFGVNELTVKGVPASDVKDMGDRLVVDRVWSKRDRVELTFGFEVEYVAQNPSRSLPQGGIYVQRGPVVFALPFDYTTEQIREHFDSGFIQQIMKVEDTTGWDYSFSENPSFKFVRMEGADLDKPFYKPVVKLQGEMLDKEGRKVPVELVPVGNTVMRRVAFPAQ